MTWTEPVATPYGVIATAEQTGNYATVGYLNANATGVLLKISADIFPASITFLVLSYDFGLG